jgi:hypothetical protein
MNGYLNSIGLQGLKPMFSRSLDVAAEAATHKDPARISFYCFCLVREEPGGLPSFDQNNLKMRRQRTMPG